MKGCSCLITEIIRTVIYIYYACFDFCLPDGSNKVVGMKQYCSLKKCIIYIDHEDTWLIVETLENKEHCSITMNAPRKNVIAINSIVGIVPVYFFVVCFNIVKFFLNLTKIGGDI